MRIGTAFDQTKAFQPVCHGHGAGACDAECFAQPALLNAGIGPHQHQCGKQRRADAGLAHAAIEVLPDPQLGEAEQIADMIGQRAVIDRAAFAAATVRFRAAADGCTAHGRWHGGWSSPDILGSRLWRPGDFMRRIVAGNNSNASERILCRPLKPVQQNPPRHARVMAGR